MKTVVQRVSHASVSVADREIGSIEQGALIFIGVGQQDTEQDVENLVDKIVNLRMFEDRQGKMNFSLLDKQGQVLIISQFTLCADTKKGRRPAFNKAASPEKAEQLYKRKRDKNRNGLIWRIHAGFFAKRRSSDFYPGY
jgi:D-tyrosyl-tRNA(Tyr) deacylase